MLESSRDWLVFKLRAILNPRRYLRLVSLQWSILWRGHIVWRLSVREIQDRLDAISEGRVKPEDDLLFGAAVTEIDKIWPDDGDWLKSFQFWKKRKDSGHEN